LSDRRLALGLAVLATAAVCGGCGDDDDAGSETLTVSAASSLTEAFETYGEAFRGTERFSFAGSDDLAAQIRQGARPDVFAAANTSYPEALYDEGLVEEPEVFARNQLVLAVPVDSSIAAMDDLVEPGIDLLIGAEGVPVGDYTQEVLSQLPQSEADATLANVRSEEPEVKGIVGKLVQGAADAGFVYASDVAATDELRAIELPSRLEPAVAYGIAVVEGAAPQADQFVDGLLGGTGADALRDAGFLPPGR
jgi:molybdate transport system substrate-binding protein